MTPATALNLQSRLNSEISGLRKMIEQLADPETGATIGGLKSGLSILARSMLRTNQLILEITQAEVEPLAGRNPRDALAALNDLFRK